jgi:DNA-binding NarL/FixJ family response regulator
MTGSTHRTSRTRAILAHADPTVRKALSDLTMQVLGMQVVGEAEDLPTLRAQVEARRPDLVIVAWTLVTADAVNALRELHGPRPEVRVVVLGPRPDARPAALAAGADAYISMVDAPDVVTGVLMPALSAGAPSEHMTQRRPSDAGDEKTQEPGGSS